MTVATEPASPQTRSTATGRMKALVYHDSGTTQRHSAAWMTQRCAGRRTVTMWRRDP